MAKTITDPEGIVFRFLYDNKCSVGFGKWIREKGAPDFFVTKGDNKFWVEVKTNKFGTLDIGQIKWIARNDYTKEKTYIAVVSNVKGTKREPTIDWYEIIIKPIKIENEMWLK